MYVRKSAQVAVCKLISFEHMFCVRCHRPARKQSLSPTAALAAAIESSLVRTWSNRDVVRAENLTYKEDIVGQKAE